MVHALIVDEKLDHEIALGQVLTGLGVSFDTAKHVSDAVTMASSQKFDVLLMSIAPPAMQTGRLGGWHSEDNSLSLERIDLPVIALTAAGSERPDPHLHSLGITEVVETSLDFSEKIRDSIRRVIPISGDEVTHSFRVQTSSVLTITDAEVPTTSDLGGGDKLHPARPCGASSSQIAMQTAPLRNQVRVLIAVALSELDQLSAEVHHVGWAEESQIEFLQLRGQLEVICQRIRDENDGPKPDESFGQWLKSMLVGPEHLVRKLLKSTTRVKFSGLFPELEGILGRIEESIALVYPPADSSSSQNTYAKNDKTLPSQAPDRLPPPSERSVIPIQERDAISGRPQADVPPGSSDAITLPASKPQARAMALVVDDNHEARGDLERKLKRLDYRVVSCESALTALELLEVQRFDVCLLDMNMPEMPGLELIQRIRNSPTAGNPSIIVVSDPAEKFAAADAIDNGADDYLEKPADERLLQARIRSCLRQTDARLAELSKFLPRNVLDRVLSNQNLLEKPSPADVSVIVCDIRGFSRISERVGPVQTIDWISDVMNELSRIILEHGGTIVDYVGDEIMAMWGAPIASPQHAGDACHCAQAIQAAVTQLSQKWRSVIGSDMRVGIGINSGLAVVGNTGSKHRIKYGPLGDTVNVASRVQGATKYLHSSVLITQSTASRIDSRLRGRRVCSVKVQNIREPVHLFELAICNSSQPSQSCTEYEEALAAFESENHPGAQTILARLLLQDPQDGPAKLLMMRVIQSQLGGSFDPVWTLPGA